MAMFTHTIKTNTIRGSIIELSGGYEDTCILFLQHPGYKRFPSPLFSEAMTDIVLAVCDHHFIGVFLAMRLKSPAIIYNYTVSGKGGGN